MIEQFFQIGENWIPLFSDICTIFIRVCHLFKTETTV